ncbi:MAG: hypothetical protein ABI432_14120 [Flavobacteriales bacterium]
MATSTERDRLERMLRGQLQLVEQVHQWLREEQKHDDILRAVVLSSRKERAAVIHGIDPDRVFSATTIRKLCVKYRLRFLDGALYKGQLPNQAVQAVRVLERKADAPLTSFKIMAPAERFRLCDSEVDPLLFVPLGKDTYYLVHKWGNDLAWHRVLLNWPFRSPVQLMLSVLLAAMVLASLVPSQWLSPDAPVFFNGQRLMLLFWSTMVCAGFTAFGWFAFFGQFSAQAWNSRYFN